MSEDQSEILAYLRRPEAFGLTDGPVETVETHGAYVFLCGSQAIKLKRAVVYDYMDLGTAEKRHALLLRELELNRPAAPSIYRDVVPVAREEDGSLAVDGAGQPLDWVLRMNRFPAEDELFNIAARGELDDRLASRIGHALATYHKATPPRPGPGAQRIGDILDELDRVFAGFPGDPVAQAETGWSRKARAVLDRCASLLDKRGAGGSVRRGHGDLHLGNIVVIDGQPLPFDALEFDETLGTCDLLYDLAFTLMDLCHRDLRRAACHMLDAWLLDYDGEQDEGLAALPLFLSVRAAIRAMVLLQRDKARGDGHPGTAEAALYLQQATDYLSPPQPICLAVGGYSGTGKSLLARALAPHLGAAPGALRLATDVLRKAGRIATDPLPAAAYAETARAGIYDAMRARAETVLGAGHSVILDATHLDPAERSASRAMARRLGVPFVGLWLDAPPDVLRRRVTERRGDASDATTAVLDRQFRTGTGPMDWIRIDATGTVRDTLANALARIPRVG